MIQSIVFHMTSNVSEKRVRGQSVEEVLAMLSLFPVNSRDWLRLSSFKDAADVRFIAPAWFVHCTLDCLEPLMCCLGITISHLTQRHPLHFRTGFVQLYFYSRLPQVGYWASATSGSLIRHLFVARTVRGTDFRSFTVYAKVAQPILFNRCWMSE